METKEKLNPFLEINKQKILQQFLGQNIPDLNFDSSLIPNSILEELDESKIMDEFIKRQKFFQYTNEQWKLLKMMDSTFRNSKDELERRREKLNQIIQKSLKEINMVGIVEIGERNPWLEMDIHEGLGYTAKSFFSNKNGKPNFYILLLENKTGEIVQEILIKEFEDGNHPRCKWNNAKEIGELKLAVFTWKETFGFVLEMDENSKKLKENYQKLEIGNKFSYQMLFSEKYSIINHNGYGITVFDSKTLQKIGNFQPPNSVLVGEFYDGNNYIYLDDKNRIFNYNLETKKKQFVNGNHPKYLITSMKISKESNTLILGHYNGNIYIYKLNLGNQQFASFRKSISTGVSNIYRMEFINFAKLMIAIRGEKNLRIVDIYSGKNEKKEIIRGNQLGIEDFKFDEKNGVFVVLASDSNRTKSKIHFLSE